MKYKIMTIERWVNHKLKRQTKTIGTTFESVPLSLTCRSLIDFSFSFMDQYEFRNCIDLLVIESRAIKKFPHDYDNLLLQTIIFIQSVR